MSEKIETKRIGAKATKNSGRGNYQKGDALIGDFTVDFKEYEKGFTVNKDAWGKICMDAMRNGNTTPALILILGSGRDRVRLWVVAEDIMEDYIRLRRLEDEQASG